MKTKYNIGDEVAVIGEITDIFISHEGIQYRIGTVTDTVDAFEYEVLRKSNNIVNEANDNEAES